MRPVEQSLLGGVLSVPAPAPLVEGLRSLAQREGTTLFTVLLAAFNILLHRYTGERHIRLWTNFANRNQPCTHEVCGWFSQTHILSMDLSGEPQSVHEMYGTEPGKKSFAKEHLVANAMALLEAIVKAKPAASKGTYLRTVTLSTTMGPGIPVDAQRVANQFKK